MVERVLATSHFLAAHAGLGILVYAPAIPTPTPTRDTFWFARMWLLGVGGGVSRQEREKVCPECRDGLSPLPGREREGGERGGSARGGRRWAVPGGPGRRGRARGALKSPARRGGGTEPRASASLTVCPPLAAAMAENSDKVPIALVGPDDVEFCSPPVSTRGPGPLPG